MQPDWSKFKGESLSVASKHKPTKVKAGLHAHQQWDDEHTASIVPVKNSIYGPGSGGKVGSNSKVGNRTERVNVPSQNVAAFSSLKVWCSFLDVFAIPSVLLGCMAVEPTCV
jgi:hypothetical protein